MVCEGKEAVPMEKTQAAIYCRLSQDDGSLGDSGSIQTHDVMYRGWNTPKNITS